MEKRKVNDVKEIFERSKSTDHKLMASLLLDIEEEMKLLKQLIKCHTQEDSVRTK